MDFNLTSSSLNATYGGNMGETCFKPEISPTVVTAAAFQGFIAGVGLIGNAIVIFVLILARDRQDTSSVIYVLNLAIADFFFLATVPFKIAQDFTLSWNLGEFMCKFAGGFLIYLNFFVSPLFLMVMSIDRYLAVNKAVSSANLRATKSSRLVSIIVWVVGVFAVLPPAMFYTVKNGETCRPWFPRPEQDPMNFTMPPEFIKVSACIEEYVRNNTFTNNTAFVEGQPPTLLQDSPGLTSFTNETSYTTVKMMNSTSATSLPGNMFLVFDCKQQALQRKGYEICEKMHSDITCAHHNEPNSFIIWLVLNFFYSYLIPSSVIVICYMAILWKLYRPSRLVHAHSRGKVRRHAMRKKVTLMVAMLVVSYMICFTPYYIWQLAKVPGIRVSASSICYDVRRFNNTMAYLNSALNPILYTFLGDQFGAKFRLAWRRVARRTERRIGSLLQRSSRNKNRFNPRRKAQNVQERLVVDEDQQCERCNGEGEEKELIERENGNEVGESPQRLKIVKVDVERSATKTSSGKSRKWSKSQSSSKKSKLSSNNSTTRTNGSKKRSSRSQKRKGVLTCMECESSGSGECPHCVAENKNSKLCKEDNNDVILHNESIVGDETQPQQSLQNGNDAIIEINIVSPEKDGITDCAVQYGSSSAGRICKKHKKLLRDQDKDGKNALDPGRLDKGRWRSTSSLRSDKFQTELTAVTSRV